MSHEKTLEEVAEERITEARRMQTTCLDLAKLELRQLPRSLSTLTALHSLNLSGNQLASLPLSIGPFRQLQELDISSNRLTALPEWVGQLEQLRHLDASNNRYPPSPTPSVNWHNCSDSSSGGIVVWTSGRPVRPLRVQHRTMSAGKAGVDRLPHAITCCRSALRDGLQDASPLVT
jgi:hypothetical protein